MANRRLFRPSGSYRGTDTDRRRSGLALRALFLLLAFAASCGVEEPPTQQSASVVSPQVTVGSPASAASPATTSWKPGTRPPDCLTLDRSDRQAVRAWQTGLNGFWGEDLIVDGVWGQRTSDATDRASRSGLCVRYTGADPLAVTTTSQAPFTWSRSCGEGSYENVDGLCVSGPVFSPTGPPVGATAKCRDGTYSFSQTRRGTCSHHGGVAQWL